MTKTIKRIIIGSFVCSVSIGVYAACGDSTCCWKNGDFACQAEGPGGEERTCTEADPSTINCP